MFYDGLSTDFYRTEIVVDSKTRAHNAVTHRIHDKVRTGFSFREKSETSREKSKTSPQYR